MFSVDSTAEYKLGAVTALLVGLVAACGATAVCLVSALGLYVFGVISALSVLWAVPIGLVAGVLSGLIVRHRLAG